MAGAAARFRVVDYLVRWLFAFTVLTALYNPTGYCFVDWLRVENSEYLAVKAFVGATLLLLLWFIFAMTWRVMKGRGVFLGLLTFAMGVGALDNLGLRPGSFVAFFVLFQACLAAWLAVGLSIVLVRQNVAGLVTSSDEH